MASKFKTITKWICKDVRAEHAAGLPWRYGAYNPRMETLSKQQRCRECGKQIKVGEQAITFIWNTSEYAYRHWDRPVYIHPAECAEWTERDRMFCPMEGN